MLDLDVRSRGQVRIGLSKQLHVFRDVPDPLGNRVPSFLETPAGRLGDVVLFPLPRHLKLGCDGKERLCRDNVCKSEREVFGRRRIETVAMQIRDRHASVMEQHANLPCSQVPEAGSVAGNAFPYPIARGTCGPVGTQSGSAFSEPQAQAVRSSMVGMMAGCASDILVAA